ncbi:MAG TPA: BON domain-containing protein [Vicinamibacterales bacterium]|nr:BON domain-containing protein [Vicinamibacterales bacterium]
MAELFGSGPQVWSPIPVPGVTYIPTIPGSPPLGGPPSAMGPQPALVTSLPMMANASPTAVAQPAAGQWASPIGGTPVLAAVEFATGVTPQTLLATIAMRRGQPMGPTNDQEIEDFIGDALDLLPGANDVEVRCDAGRATLTGSVPQKRLKRDIGEVAWTIPNVNDVQNNITIAARRRSRSGRESETPPMVGGTRKQT